MRAARPGRSIKLGLGQPSLLALAGLLDCSGDLSLDESETGMTSPEPSGTNLVPSTRNTNPALCCNGHRERRGAICTMTLSWHVFKLHHDEL